MISRPNGEEMTAHCRLTLLYGVIAFLFVAMSFPLRGQADAQPHVTGYSPAMVDPGAAVTIMGNSFGSSQGTRIVQYGLMGSTAPAGAITTIRRWSGSAIDVQLPAPMAAGTYWLAIYDGGRLRGNQLAGLTVRGVSSGGPKPTIPFTGVTPLPPEVREKLAAGLASSRPHDVTITLERLYPVISGAFTATGDTATPGDWIVVFSAAAESSSAPVHMVWPPSGTMDVTGELRPGIQLHLNGVSGTERIEVGITVVECDVNGSVPVSAEHFGRSASVSVNCRGEESGEPVGANQTTHLGTSYTPEQWTSANVLQRRRGFGQSAAGPSDVRIGATVYVTSEVR
jgi:hypothetical protein